MENIELKNSTESTEIPKNNKPSKTKKLRIYCGSYEGKMFCLDFDLKSKESKNFMFKVSDNSLRVINCLNNQSKTSTEDFNYIFVSGTDEIIHLYDMEKREDKGSIFSYCGTISNIQFPNGKKKNFLFISGDDSNITIYRMSDFQKIHALKGHTKAVTTFVIHESNKFCISAGKDSSIIIWNLIKGKKISQFKLDAYKICNKLILWKNSKYVLCVYDNEFQIFDLFTKSENYKDWILDTKRLIDIDESSKIIDSFILKEKIILILSNGTVVLYSESDKNTKNEEFSKIPEESDEKNISKFDFNIKKINLEKPVKAKPNDLDHRVKLCHIAEGEKLKLLISVWSNNEIYIYDMNRILKSDKTQKNETNDEEEVKKFHSVNLRTGDRLTCLNSFLL